MDSLILSRLLNVTARLDDWLVIESCDTLLLNFKPCTAGLLYGNLHGEFGGGGSSSNPRLSVPASFMWLLTSSSFLDDSRLKEETKQTKKIIYKTLSNNRVGRIRVWRYHYPRTLVSGVRDPPVPPGSYCPLASSCVYCLRLWCAGRMACQSPPPEWSKICAGIRNRS